MDQEGDSAYGYRWQDGTLSWEPLWQELLADLAKGIEARLDGSPHGFITAWRKR
jgi:hypothetical protein